MHQKTSMKAKQGKTRLNRVHEIKITNDLDQQFSKKNKQQQQLLLAQRYVLKYLVSSEFMLIPL